MDFIVHRWEAWLARRDEREALLLLGESLPPSADVEALDDKVKTLERMLAVSMVRDRADYAAVASWARPLVVARGLLDRAVMRALQRRAAKDRADACVKLAAASLESAQGAQAVSAREASTCARTANAQVGPLPLVAREAGHFGRYVWKEARGQLLPRVPALIGLGVGFWIAQTFTDSQLSATLHAWGLGSGPRHAVRGETLRAMSFALPLFAAALTSYAGSRLGALIEARYAPAPDRPR
jgi:hypothetical protein